MTLDEAKQILNPETSMQILNDSRDNEEFADRCLAASLTAVKAIEELQAYKQAEQDGTLVKLPCKKGDTIIQFKWVTSVGMSIYSDKVTKVVQSKNGFTIYTKKVFYPIKTEEHDIAPISEYPNALADFYIGTKEEAEKALEGMK